MALPDAGAADFLRDVQERREFMYNVLTPPGRDFPLPGLQLHGAQRFVSTFMSPDTPYHRLLLNWDTGTGKTIPALTIAMKFLKNFAQLARARDGTAPRVYVIGFSQSVMQDELLRRPELGMVTHSALAELRRLYALRQQSPEDARRYSGYLGALKRQMVDPKRGGRFRFFGYREFATALFQITPAGAHAGDTVAALFAGTPNQSARRVAEAERAGRLRINAELLKELADGLLIADEIHETYNILEKNTYGIAIQYVLDALVELKRPCRALFMSATPLSGSPHEVVDLINLLVPGSPARRADLFDGKKLRAGALERITRWCRGRVSYYRKEVSPDAGFPTRTFDGEPLAGVPYLKFELCKLSSQHEAALRAVQTPDKLLPLGQQSLDDILFPTPDGAPQTREGVAKAIATAAPAWRSHTGIELDEFGNVTGPLLKASRLEKYSGKYARVAKCAADAGGKVLAYHPRVRMGGVLLVQEVLKFNGFAEFGGPVLSSTLCMCGAPRAKHGKQLKQTNQTKKSVQSKCTTFTPMRVAVITGDMDGSKKERILRAFNSAGNLRGAHLKVLIGSNVIRQSLNFTAVRNLFVLSLPDNFSTLIQILGRPSRQNAYRGLPEEEHDFRVRIFIYAATNFKTPDVIKLRADAADHQLIQEIMRAIRVASITPFEDVARDSLEELAMRSPTSEADFTGTDTSTYDAHGYRQEDVQTIQKVLSQLFQRCAVWTQPKLLAEIQALQLPRRSGAFGADLLVDAMRGMLSPPTIIMRDGERTDVPHFVQGGIPKRIVRVASGAAGGVPPAADKTIFVAVPMQGGEVVDVEAYIRDVRPQAIAEANVLQFVEQTLDTKNTQARVRNFMAHLPADPTDATIEVLRQAQNFQVALLKAISQDATAAAKRIRKIYTEFRVLRRGGFILGDEYVRRGKGWDVRVAPRTPRAENPSFVGYFEAGKFKIRPSLASLRTMKARDARSLLRGAVCETRTKREQAGIAAALKLSLPNDSAQAACRKILTELLRREREARRDDRGVRWFYLAGEPQPALHTTLRSN
ncbi:MAG: DEAD/DEAH box helicase [Sulfitobacter sp.]|nr:DEAD/DEAH box helicase [Sulfitobacter sp.]